MAAKHPADHGDVAGATPLRSSLGQVADPPSAPPRRLATARGLVIGVAISLVLWALLAGIAYLILR